MLSFNNQKIFVTGATSGIGRAVVDLLSQQGVFVVLCGRNFDKLKTVQKGLKNPAKSELFKLNFSDLSNFKDKLAESVEKSGKFTGFVHCAGIDITKPYKLLKTEDFNALYELNITIPFELSKSIIHKKFFNHEGGSLVWLGSVMGQLGQKGKIAYTANKSAIEGLVKSYALELASKKIRVNCVAPGIVKTPLTDELFSKLSTEQIETIENMHPLGFGSPRDVANLVAFLVSDQSTWITGTTHTIDGGYHIQ